MAWLKCEHTITKNAASYALTKPLTTLGRAKGADLTLEDGMVAQSHATVVRQGNKHTISLAERSAELYVNGRRTRSAELKTGDSILIGAWQCTYLDGEPDEEAFEDVKGLSLARMQRLVTLSADLMRDTTPERLFTDLLAGIVELTRAEKGFLIVFRDGARHLAASHNVTDEQLDLTRVSDSIVKQVVDSRAGLILSDAMNDSRFGRAKSVVDLRLSSVMCVPMIYRNDLLGVVYLGNDSITDLFTEADLAVLKIYAAQAALVVHHALLVNQLRVDNRNLRERLRRSAQGSILGNHTTMKAMFKAVRRVAPTDLSVLVLGETGTGKELVARELHTLSGRKQGAFIAINCGAIPENLLESELFGHKKGAFTGAVTDKIGKVEAADGGTLFLDEIGEMPMNLQVKLLRVLQERVIERVGELKPRPIDVRVVAATNKDLKELISEGKFREDLLYRLNEMEVRLPPLRERGDDIELLAQYFLNRYREQYQASARGFTNQGLLALKGYYWPGNVRELESRVRKALIMTDRALLNPADLGLDGDVKRSIRPLAEAQEDFKLEYIRSVLDMNNWNKAQTARDLGVDARTIFRYVEKLEE
jgi:transcriptional regulator with GAF, ATPase, and Fis domain